MHGTWHSLGVDTHTAVVWFSAEICAWFVKISGFKDHHTRSASPDHTRAAHLTWRDEPPTYFLRREAG